MSQADREARMLAAIYRTYGVSADWKPADGGASLSPMVRHDVSDEVSRDVLQRTNVIYVRLTDIEEPARDDLITTARGTFRINRNPRMTDDGLEWLCEVVKA